MSDKPLPWRRFAHALNLGAARRRVAQLRHGEQGTGRLFGSACEVRANLFVCAQDDGKIEELLDIVRDVVKGWPFDD